MNITFGSSCTLRWTIDFRKNSSRKPKVKLNPMSEDKETAAEAEGQKVSVGTVKKSIAATASRAPLLFAIEDVSTRRMLANWRH